MIWLPTIFAGKMIQQSKLTELKTCSMNMNNTATELKYE